MWLRMRRRGSVGDAASLSACGTELPIRDVRYHGIWTTVFLTWIQIYLVADDVEDLALAYLLPTIFIAVFFGSTLAIAGSFVSALAAAYFLYPPKFSLYIADPTHAVELGFILLLSVTASKAIGVMTDDRRR
jgi:K+-sensing histidine kinase KdpD